MQEIWSFYHENHQICCHQMSDFKAKMHQIQFRLGLRPRPRWGSFSTPPPPSRNRGVLLLREGREKGGKRRGGGWEGKREGRGGEKEEEGKREGRGGEGYGKGRGRDPPLIADHFNHCS